MSVRRLFTLRNFKGILEKVSPRDIPDDSLVKCENWDVDSEYGKLKAGKGWSDLLDANFGTGKGKGMIEVDQPRDGDGVAVLLAQDTDTKIARWRYDGSAYSAKTQLDVTTLDANATIDRFRPNVDNHNIFGGTGVGANNIPVWYGFLKYNRFYKTTSTGEADTDYFENINEYLFAEEEVKPSTLHEYDGSVNAPVGDDVICIRDNSAGSTDASLTTARYLQITATLVYSNGQESPLPMGFNRSEGKSVNINVDKTFPIQTAYISNNGSLKTAKTDKKYHLDLYIKPVIDKRVIAINLYIRHEESTSYYSGFKYWRTIYLDETVYQEYYDDTTALNDEQHSMWEEITSGDFAGWYRFNPKSVTANDSALVYHYDRDYAGSFYESRIDYIQTKLVMPHYKYSKIVNDVRYVGPVRYGEEYYPDVVIYSPAGSPNILPTTNYIKLPGTVSGIGSLRDRVILFTESSMNIYTGSSFIENYSEYGCVSHDSIIEHSGVLYWAGKYGLYAYDGFYPRKISAISIDSSYNSLSLADKREILSVLDLKNNQIIWSVPNGQMFIYSLESNSWTTKSTPLEWMAKDARQNIIVSSGTDLFLWDDGYNYPTSYGSTVSVVYNCDAKTKKIDLRESGVIKTLMFGYIGYKSPGNTVTLKVLYEDTVYSTIILPSQSTMAQYKFSLSGLKLENFQLELYVEGVSNDVEIDFIDIWGTVNYIK